jgi:hypothetical protein
MTDVLTPAPRPRLGKLPAKHDRRTLQLANYLQPAALPPAPESRDWASKVASWPMMLNDQLGCCTIAAAGHMIQLWHAWTDCPDVPSDTDVRAAYEAVSGYDPATGLGDNGAVALDVLNYWRQTGVGSDKIEAFAALEPRNQEHVRAALNLFGGVYVGLQLPLSAQGQRVWSVPPGGPQPGTNADPGSWGGHAVCAIAYDEHGLTVVTWGQLQRMTWNFWRAYTDEAFCLLNDCWIDPAKKLAPSGFDFAALQADLAAVAR